ncbi:MAG TPA: hypothetical protein VMN60_11210, partial [Longimicrobiales bacterium]|nr:hypothetical protein [Longimicrobiales bacterium]
MKALLIVTVLLLPACEFTRELAAGGASARPVAQAATDTLRTTVRRVSSPLDNGASFFDMVVMPDGRSGVLVDDDLGDIAVIDLGSGTLRRVTQNTANWVPGGADTGGHTRVSHDGRFAAYTWYNDSTQSWEMRSVPLAGGAPRVLYHFNDFGWIEAKSW